MSRALRMGRGSGCGPDADAKKSDDFYDSPDRNGASGRETVIDAEKYGDFCDSGITAMTAIIKVVRFFSVESLEFRKLYVYLRPQFGSGLHDLSY